MRTAITIGYRHGSTKPEVLALPDVPIGEQFEGLANIAPDRTHNKWRRVEVWSSDEGLVRYREYTPEPKAEKAKV